MGERVVFEPNKAIGFNFTSLACILPSILASAQGFNPAMLIRAQGLAFRADNPDRHAWHRLAHRARFIGDLMDPTVGLKKICGRSR